MAKAFLYTIVGILVAVFAGAIMLNFFWKEALELVSIPRTPFAEQAPPEEPDYTSGDAWYERPTAPTLNQQAVAVFFITPTGYFRASHWNGPIDAPETQEFYTHIARPFAVEVFGVLPVFAPRYRQATFGAFFALENGGEDAFDLATSDIIRAFEAFWRAHPEQPFILAGHEQGSLHGLKLLQQTITGTEIEQWLVVAYLPGIPIPLSDLDNTGLPICGEQNQTRCMVSWTVSLGGQNEDVNLLCVNPLNWNINGQASSTDSLGARLPSGDGYTPVDYQVGPGAKCNENGYLNLPEPVSDLVRGLKDPMDRVGIGDYGLFFQNIRQNVQQRVRAYESYEDGQ